MALDEDDPRELIDGELVEVEVPGLKHEQIVIRLAFYLHGWVEEHGGLVLASGYKVRVSDTRGVMPDVQFYRAGNEPGVDQERGLVRGRPDLAIEILSPSSRRYDRIVKLGYYASLRVPHYWLVDPEARLIECLAYSPKGYVIAEACEGERILTPVAFPGLEIPLAKIWPTQSVKRHISKARAKPLTTKSRARTRRAR